MSVVCNRCDTSEWEVRKQYGFFGRKRYYCKECGRKAWFDVWVNDEYVGPKDKDPKEASGEKQWKEKLRNGITPCCESDVDNLKAGASGGSCVNFTCANCGARWNIAFGMGDILMVERLI